MIMKLKFLNSVLNKKIKLVEFNMLCVCASLLFIVLTDASSAEYSIGCSNGIESINENFLCDGENDCADFSDERTDFCEKLKQLRSGCGDEKQIYCEYQDDCYDLRRACDLGQSCSETSDFVAVCKGIEGGTLQHNKEKKRVDCICEAKQNNNTIDVMNYLASAFNAIVSNISMAHVCPPLYIQIGSHCISFFTPAKLPWSEANIFCESISGHLMILKDISLYKQLLDYIQDNDIISHFWIGGSFKRGNWIWLNGSSVELGSPFWAIHPADNFEKLQGLGENSQNTMMPRTSAKGRCISIKSSNFYYFSDEDCHQDLCPICEYGKI